MSWENKRFVANLSSVGFQSPVPPEVRVQCIDCVKKSKFPCFIHCGVSPPFWHRCPYNALCLYVMVRMGCPAPGVWTAVYLFWWVLRMVILHINQQWNKRVSLFERPCTLSVKWCQSSCFHNGVTTFVSRSGEVNWFEPTQKASRPLFSLHRSRWLSGVGKEPFFWTVWCGPSCSAGNVFPIPIENPAQNPCPVVANAIKSCYVLHGEWAVLQSSKICSVCPGQLLIPAADLCSSRRMCDL